MRPKPVELHRIAGTDRPTNQNRQQCPGKPLEAVPKPPEWLQGVDALRHWHDVLEPLVARHTVSETDLGAFALLCHVWGCLVQQAKAGDPLRGPLVSKYLALCTEFGLTPASAAKIRPESGAAQMTHFSKFKGVTHEEAL